MAVHTSGWIGVWKKEAKAEKYFIPTVKYGGGCLMLWGYIASTGTVVLVKVNGTMKLTKEQGIFAKNLVASAGRLTIQSLFFLLFFIKGSNNSVTHCTSLCSNDGVCWCSNRLDCKQEPCFTCILCWTYKDRPWTNQYHPRVPAHRAPHHLDWAFVYPRSSFASQKGCF
jgi:hypothetical protein